MLDAISSVFGFSFAPQEVVISELFVFPIKSCRGIRLESSELTARGLKYDRKFALMNKKGIHISLRCHPKMATITTAFSEDGLNLVVSAPDMPSIEVPLEESPGEKTYEQMTIFEDPCEVFEVDPAFSNWFCEALKIPQGTRFVRMAEHFVRNTNRKVSPSGQHALADCFPYLLASEKSLDEVNARLEVPVTMENFRPNIIVKTSTAFEVGSLKVTL